jgi:hypothetical protein
MKVVRLIALSCILIAGTVAAQQVPGLLNYQGRVSAGGTNFDGTGQFRFALVDGTGAATYWSNGVGTVSLPVTKGLYSTVLGDTGMASIPSAVFTNADVRLRVWFDDGVHGEQQLAPDPRIAAVGYALMAASVPDGAITGGKLADGAVQLEHIGQNGAVAGQMMMWTNSAWTLVDAPPGPQGAAGATGATGAKGDTGTKAPQVPRAHRECKGPKATPEPRAGKARLGPRVQRERKARREPVPGPMAVARSPPRSTSASAPPVRPPRSTSTEPSKPPASAATGSFQTCRFSMRMILSPFQPESPAFGSRFGGAEAEVRGTGVILAVVVEPAGTVNQSSPRYRAQHILL